MVWPSTLVECFSWNLLPTHKFYCTARSIATNYKSGHQPRASYGPVEWQECYLLYFRTLLQKLNYNWQLQNNFVHFKPLHKVQAIFSFLFMATIFCNCLITKPFSSLHFVERWHIFFLHVHMYHVYILLFVFLYIISHLLMLFSIYSYILYQK